MITYGFDYAADRFDSENPVQMATLEWSTVDEDGEVVEGELFADGAEPGGDGAET